MTDALGALQDRLHVLESRQEIADCLARYSRGVDRGDRELVLSAYHPDGTDDHGQFVGTATEFADWALGMHQATHVSHQHCLFQHTCDLDGDTAHTETYFIFLAMHQHGKPWSMTAGRYLDRFERRDGRWAIAHRVCVRGWAPTDRGIGEDELLTLTGGSTPPAALLELMRQGPAPRRSPEDPSYERPLQLDPERLAAWRSLNDE